MAQVATVKDVQLTSKDNEENVTDENEQLVQVKVTFLTHVGLGGILIMLFMLLVATVFLYVTSSYTADFHNFKRSYVWMFMVMSLLFSALTIYYLLRWRKMVETFTNAADENPQNMATSCFRKNKNRYNSFQIYGKYYLWQLYICELLESVVQMGNLVNVYLCSLPVVVTTSMCIILGIDCYHSARFMLLDNDVSRRNRQIIIDTCMDFFCTAFPLIMMWFGYQVPISIADMMQISIFPALMLFLKLDTILEEIIRSRTAVNILKVQRRLSAKSKRSRKSLFGEVAIVAIAQQQQATVPYTIHIASSVCKGIFGSIFLVIGITQVAISFSVDNNLRCESLLWDSCVVKTPFCKSLLQPTCNCAVLHVRKHNWTELPSEIYEMRALKIMQVNHGSLSEIPADMDKTFVGVSRLDFSFNQLKSIPESLGKMKVLGLYLRNNKLKTLPDSVWENDYIFELALENNNITKISPVITNAKSIGLIKLSNNSLTGLPVELFSLNLILLYVDGNQLKNIPSEIHIATTLRYVKFNNNHNISIVPDEIGNLAQLEDVDLRNNAVEFLPDSFESLSDIQYVYLSGNPICKNGWLENAASKKMQEIVAANNAGCVAQCSIYCQDEFLGDNECDAECNVKQCSYDGGDCIL